MFFVFVSAQCVGDAELTGRQIFLKETSANGSVAVPPRAADLDCYARTKFRRVYGSGATNLAVGINGELQRLDPNTTLPQRVVRPYSKKFNVAVYLTVQSRRPKLQKQDWHSSRFVGMPQYDDTRELRVLETLAERFLRAGALVVKIHLYELIRRPPQMPSKYSGANPGHASVARFQLVWPSYALHLLVHSLLWRDIEGHDFLIKMRADARWLKDAPVVGDDLDAHSVSVKACLPWEGLNDKVAIIPFKYSSYWMQLLELYYDPTFHGYKNSEQFQRLVALRYHIPVTQEPTKLAVLDYYWWLPDQHGGQGCFPWNYAGVQSPTRCQCLTSSLCPQAYAKLCAGNRPLGPGTHTRR